MRQFRILEKMGDCRSNSWDMYYYPQIRAGWFKWKSLHGINKGNFIKKVTICDGLFGWKDKEMAKNVILFYKQHLLNEIRYKNMPKMVIPTAPEELKVLKEMNEFTQSLKIKLKNDNRRI